MRTFAKNKAMLLNQTIVALATAAGSGAIAVLRISGPKTFEIADRLFVSVKGKKLSNQKTHTVHLGYVEYQGRTLDQVLATVFRNPNSYTGEDTVEFSCHGSPFIQQQLLQTIIAEGAKMADPGEFTLRAFLNGKLDLSQAEAVADLIAADSEAGHQLAMQQMRGGFSNEIQHLRSELLNFASLIELELDFAEEDVAFADRTEFRKLLERIQLVLKRLIDSFAVGNVLKNGIPVAIVGEPNVGKSTLLNALLNEERAIVSDIAGTTRDTIEDEMSLGGIAFRFIDTAGIRETIDVVEKIGIQKTFEKISQAQVVMYLFDATKFDSFSETYFTEIERIRNQYPGKALLVVLNKTDLILPSSLSEMEDRLTKSAISFVGIAAKTGEGVPELKNKLLSFVETGALRNNDTIVTNSRHYDALLKALSEIQRVQWGLDSGISSDLMAIDLREALYHFGTITGEVSNDELLGNIFANFCIGK